MRPPLIRSAVVVSMLALAGAAQGLLACSGGDSEPVPISDTPDAGEDEPGAPELAKVDILFVVDNSAMMMDKTHKFADSLGTLLRFSAQTIGDVHVGVIDTSLGAMGGDLCDNTAFTAKNSLSHLRTTNADGARVAGVANGVLAYRGGDPEPFVQAAEALVRGVGMQGCGFEAQLESAYRFLVQPDPWQEVVVDKDLHAKFVGVDTTLLAQRKAFLRNDSALIVVLVTDEDDSSVDPRATGGMGWAFASKEFPESKIDRNGQNVQGTTAPRGTYVCITDPASPECISCGVPLECAPGDARCQNRAADPNCSTSGLAGQSGEGFDGFYGPDDDDLNVRFHRMKERFGVDPQYPIARYVNGLTNPKVPDRTTEHTTTSDGIGDYVGTPKCTNPIFAEALPGSDKEELCELAPGRRPVDRVLFAVLGGLPPALATGTPDWTKILGSDPDAYDTTGIDPHMLQSTEPRPGLEPPSSVPGDDGSDPVHGRERATNKADLQYACTFPLPEPRQCSGPSASCPCEDPSLNSPLCSETPGEQLRAGAVPTPRPLRVARALGDSGVIGSVCAPSYEPTMMALVARLTSRLTK